MQKAKLHAQHITEALLRHHINWHNPQQNWTIPNYTPRDWWECDVANFTRAGKLSEYEIKVDRNDFKADFKKARDPRGRSLQYVQSSGKTTYLQYKHDLIAAGRGPWQFWFVTPMDLIDLAEVPDYAGLIFVGGPRSPVQVIKRPQQFNRTKLLYPDIRDRTRLTFYMRYYGSKNGILKTDATYDEKKELGACFKPEQIDQDKMKPTYSRVLCQEKRVIVYIPAVKTTTGTLMLGDLSSALPTAQAARERAAQILEDLSHAPPTDNDLH